MNHKLSILKNEISTTFMILCLKQFNIYKYLKFQNYKRKSIKYFIYNLSNYCLNLSYFYQSAH